MSTINSLFYLIFCLSSLLNCIAQVSIDKQSFLYFAYGSNLLDQYIHINNPQAMFYSPAELKGYRLDFKLYVPMWRGAVATIAKDPTCSVWGALWIIDRNDLKKLDDQEGVNLGWYIPTKVSVRTPSGQKLVARTYIDPVDLPNLKTGETLPLSRRPSITYLQVISVGALKAGLPSGYMKYIDRIPTNGNFADESIVNTLGYPFNM